MDIPNHDEVEKFEFPWSCGIGRMDWKLMIVTYLGKFPPGEDKFGACDE